MGYKDPDKQREFQREWTRSRAALRRALIRERGDACERCGWDDIPVVLEFHHRDPAQKKFRMNQRSRSDVTMRAEAAKCDLLCPNCHAVDHFLS